MNRREREHIRIEERKKMKFTEETTEDIIEIDKDVETEECSCTAKNTWRGYKACVEFSFLVL